MVFIMPRTQVLWPFTEGLDLWAPSNPSNFVGPLKLRIFCDSVTHKESNPADNSAL